MPIPQLTKSPKEWQRHKKNKLFNRLKKARSLLAAQADGLKKHRHSLKDIASKLIILGVILVLLGGILFIAALAWFSKDVVEISKINDIIMAESTKIYDSKGETLLFDIHGNEKRTIVELDQISDYIKWATISAEDRHFYEHHGINFFSIIQAVILDPLRGRGIRGGSTLTQQYVKNAILTNEKSISRKMKEWILAYQLEKKYTKDQILKMYFNKIPYGSVNYGVEAAANNFFGKSAKNVTLAEAAILAALPQAPTRLSPYGSHTDQLFARQHWVLDQMVEEGYVTKEQAEAAKAEKIEFNKEAVAGILAPHFVFYVKELLAEQLGENILEQGGLKVTTTLDMDKQKIAEDAVHNAKENNLTKYNASNAALVSVDAKNGQILAMVGSQDYTDDTIDGQVNVATSPRQPGSSIKPVVYAAAFEKGFTTETILYDTNTIFATSPKIYEPHDYDSKERGPLTMRAALAGSLNIPAVKTLYLAGYDYVKKLMQTMGYSTITDQSQCGLALVLGGCEVKLIDHVGAFTAFARDGERAELAAILKVEDKTGKALYEFKEKKHKVLSENSVRQINSIMTDTTARSFIFGAAPNLTLPDRPVAAKTGTTNDNNDGWTIGFTPSIVTGVWAGNSDGANMKGNADGVNVAAPIWHEYMQKILAGTPVEYFKAPEPLSEDLPPMLRGQAPSDMEVEIDKASGKLATPLTPESYKIKKKFNQHHDILYYINKDNPAGPPPENPAADPMFQPWEDGVKQWAEKIAKEQNIEITNELAPTEYDDLHVPQNAPTITLLSPQDKQTLSSYPVTFSAQASAPRGISRVVFSLGEQIIGAATSQPFTLTVSSLDAANGYQQLKATAYDDIDNSASIQIEINLKLPVAPPQVNWISPRDNASFYKSTFPLTFNFTINKSTEIQSITFYAQGFGIDEQKIAQVMQASSDQMSFAWQNAPSPGSYQIYAQIQTNNGNKSESSHLNLNVLE